MYLRSFGAIGYNVNTMKKGIHPKFYPEAKVTCSCGNTFTVGSTLPEIKTELCSACHPFFTGQEKLIDTERRVEKFEKKIAQAKAAAKEQTRKKQQKKEKEKKTKERPRTLREMIKTAKS